MSGVRRPERKYAWKQGDLKTDKVILLAVRDPEFVDSVQSQVTSLVNGAPHPKGCLVWVGAAGRDGRGNVWIPTRFKKPGITVTAPRVAWFIANPDSEPKDDLKAIHDCDNPACMRVGAGHIRMGTQSENIRDSWSRGGCAMHRKQA